MKDGGLHEKSGGFAMIFRDIGVLGAGIMGSEITIFFALAGYKTVLSDRNRASGEQALENLEGVLDKGVARSFWSSEAASVARQNCSAVEGLDAYADRDLVIEAVFEDEAIATADTEAGFADTVAETLATIGKTLVHIKNVAPFVVNRLFHALVLDSIRLVAASYDERKADRGWYRYDKSGKRT